MSNFQAKARPEPAQPDLYNFAVTEGETKILAFSGKLNAGKDSCCRFLYSLAFMYQLGLTHNALVNEETGKLWIETEDGLNEVDEDSRHPEVRRWLDKNVWPFMRKFSTADPMKDFLRKMFEIPSESLWGSDEDKNKPIEHLLWENMPGDPQLKLSNGKKLGEMTGSISGRQMMEYIGTEVIRKLYPKAHAKALVSDILEYNSNFSLVNDVRFIDEAEELHSVGAKIIRLTRCSEKASKNKHRSNVELDNFDGFDKVIDNANMTMNETFAELMSTLIEWEFFKVVQQ